MNKLFVFFQRILPQHGLSRMVGKIAQCQKPRWFKNGLIRLAIRVFKINMNEAEERDIHVYPSFNAFFIRHLKKEVRPMAPTGIISPADGGISQIGDINGTALLQAKGRTYSLQALLANDQTLVEAFTQGRFATIYLSPRDYHRVHMPYDGVLEKMIYVPGKLFSVNCATTEGVGQLFACNERAICIFDTEFGKMAVIFVGAMLVAGIHTAFAGQVCPSDSKSVSSIDYRDQHLSFKRGDELGYFKYGSTVIVLLPEQAPAWSSIWQAGDEICLGQSLSG